MHNPMLITYQVIKYQHWAMHNVQAKLNKLYQHWAHPRVTSKYNFKCLFLNFQNNKENSHNFLSFYIAKLKHNKIVRVCISY